MEVVGKDETQEGLIFLFKTEEYDVKLFGKEFVEEYDLDCFSSSG